MYTYISLSSWWFGTCFIFPYLGNFIIPIDLLIFFRGVGIHNQPAIILGSSKPPPWFMPVMA